MKLTEHIFDSMNVILPYLFSQPGGNGAPGRYPLIFFLHGAGERGRDLDMIRHYGIPKMAARWKDFPFFTVSPQCPPHTYWEDLDTVLLALLDDILARYPVDPGRVYLTGLSMGGHGTWVLGLQEPQRFAALAPVCPPFPNVLNLPQRLLAIKEKPVWVFHGGKDDVVPVEHSRRMVDMLRKLDAPVKYTVYPNARHDSWIQAYADPGLYGWFLEHSLQES